MEQVVEKALREPVLDVRGELRHWIDVLADWLEQKLRERGKQEYVFNGGLSVSGLPTSNSLRLYSFGNTPRYRLSAESCIRHG
ncbi:MAG TPA: hypothetical protein EYP08_03950 [Pyrodictiaceae archaeon]|nr:hypothetical protein [Pyrodictiaceae archaeon]